MRFFKIGVAPNTPGGRGQGGNNFIGNISPPSNAPVVSPSNADSTIQNLIRMVITLLLIAAVLLIIWAAFKFITSRGESTEVSKAQKIIWYVIVGILVIVAAFPIIDWLLKEITGTGLPTSII